jgi:fatty-acyl-CoA synthase
MQSYARGLEAELLECTIHDRFLETVRRNPDGEALIVVDQGVRLTWAGLAAEVERTARGLAGLGFGAGSRVGIWATNCAEWILLQLAASRAGVILVNINPAYRAHELEYVLRKSRIEAIFLRESDERSCYREILERAMYGRNLPLRDTIYIGEGSWDRFIEGGREIAPLDASPHDVANIQYTSGTTGSPKGVLLSHSNVVNNGRFIGMWLKATARDRICVPVPLYHCFGCVIGAMVSINTGAAMVLPAARFHALPTMQTVERERCTLLYGVPTMFIAQLNHADFAKFDFSSLRGGIMAGAPCPVEIMKRVLTEMHCPEITIVYGQTESSPVITGATADDTLEHRTRTVGCTFPATEIKLVDRETGETVERGAIGEICARGYPVMRGYDDDPAATREAIDADGWLHTGDLAVMLEDGYLHLTGRAKDVIIRGGENVYPKEVESFLYEHPKVASAEVVGVPDMKFGEAVAAWIILRPGEEASEDEIRAFCERGIAHFKVPKYIRFVDSFPTTVTGKTQKYVIREREIEMRGLEEAARLVTA